MSNQKIHDNILGVIGDTPMVRINRITKDVAADVYAKIETFNPGNSIKDRMAVKMIEDAERSGALRPGGTIIEGTSGNTGMGLAIAAVVKGYKCIFTTTDKQSKEKVDALKAFGAEVIVCPTNVDPEDPRSYYSVSSRLQAEVPNSWKANQYDNLSNSKAHYEQTGPEIWEQTGGKVDHLVMGVGTGGTLVGVGQAFREVNPSVKLFAMEPSESATILCGEVGEHLIEGIADGFVPGIFQRHEGLVDTTLTVDSGEAVDAMRSLAQRHGLFVGPSSGANLIAARKVREAYPELETLVTLFCDEGEKYIQDHFADEVKISSETFT